MKRIFLAAAFALLTAGPGAVSAQQARVVLKGDAYLLSDGKHVALEVAGKVVIGFDAEFTEIITSTGNYFAARYEEEDSDWYIYDRNGEEVELGSGSYGWSFDKVSMVAGTIVVVEKGKTYYFSENDLSTAIKPQAAGHDFFEKEIEKKTGQPVFNPEKMAQGKSSEQAEYLSSLVPEAGRFEIRPKPNSNRQQIFVKGKMLDEAQEYKVVSTPEVWNEWGYWILITKNGGYYGLLGIEVREENGKQIVRKEVLIPHKYTYGIHHDGNMLKFTKRGGVPEWFNWWGYNFDNDWRTGKFTPTYKQWILDKSTGEWSLVKQEPKK